MPDGDRVRIELGFDGGQILNTFAEPESADRLERALEAEGNGVVVLDTEDGPVHVVVARVAYFRRHSRAGRVGFS